MSIVAVLGLQFGDEGKGKAIDYLLKNNNFDVCARAQGGSNAGHTVKVNNKTFKLHLIPSGILIPNVECLIGHGCVVNPDKLIKEIKGLIKEGVPNVIDRLHIASSSHIVLDEWINEDENREKNTSKPIGTTKQGIGPTYAHKMYRDSVRMEFLALESPWNSMVTDGTHYLMKNIIHNKNILIEGANATMLDIDVGTYPYVTSSNTTIGGLISGTGIPPHFSYIFGVIKAYLTRVGNGPMPTEDVSDIGGKHMQIFGKEYGTTTDRVRRCGWLDLPMLAYSCFINGITELILTKLDVLSGLEEIKICTHYKRIIDISRKDPRAERDEYYVWPSDWKFIFSLYEPVYKTMPGWDEDISNVRKFEDLPINAQKYVEFIEGTLGKKIYMIGVGSEREDVIIRSSVLKKEQQTSLQN